MTVEARRLFEEAEVRAERTVALLRVAVALILAGIFLLAVVGTAPAGDVVVARQHHLALATMAGYLALGLLSFWLAATGRLRLWMPWVFVTLDVGFIVVSVDLGLRNTALPSHYLAGLPVIWLAPRVLGFGALRYNPYLQADVTLALAAGLVPLAGAGDPWGGPLDEAPPVGLRFFFGAPPNAMRLVMLLLAGLVLVIAAARARALLRRAIDEARRRANLTRYLPPEIADWLAETSADELRRGRRQTVAVLFADVRGFTERAETMDPAALGRFVTEFRRRVGVAAERHGGVIDKFVGDSAMVVFGVPDPRPTDARDALRCAREVLASVAAWGDGARVGVGVHFGEVFCGAVGDETRLEFTVLGDTVNVAARIEQATKAAGFPLIASKELLDAAGEDPASDPRWTSLPPEPLRGRHRPVRLFGTACGGPPAPRAADLP
ncbi:MAG TPA: adenylate/guanylate cyclase domain-containing protein [Geminicoccaceae bacterium]|nr:adenylate/guanylate cyclase domain-containing protein [Geminicoccaceae bacterium]